MASYIERIQQLRNSGLLSAEETSAVIKTTYPTLKSSTVAHLVLAVFDEAPTGPSMMDLVAKTQELETTIASMPGSKRRPIVVVEAPQEPQEAQESPQVPSEETAAERKKRKAREYYQKNKVKILAKAKAAKEAHKSVRVPDIEVPVSPVYQHPAISIDSDEHYEPVLTQKEFEGIDWWVDESTGEVFGVAGDMPLTKSIGRLSVKRQFKKWLHRPSFLADEDDE